MNFYLCDLLSVAGCQLSGVSISESPLVNRLIEERVILERIRPLEDKMNYKIDKLRSATSSVLSFKLRSTVYKVTLILGHPSVPSSKDGF